MLEIQEFTEARLTSVTNRTEKHGDEDVPAVSLAVEITAANTLLDAIDPNIRHALYKAVEDQEQLPGVEPATPVLRCNSFDTVALTTSHEGWRLHVDDGIDETEPMEFTGVKVDKLRVDAKQGGSIILKMRLGTSDVDADRLGKLGMHNGQSIWIKVLKPEKAAEAIDGTTEAFRRDHPGAEGQGDLLATGEDGAGTGDDAGEGDGLGTFADDMARGSGDGPDDDDHDDDGSGHTDDGAAEQAALEAGMAASIAAAGVKPKRGSRAKAH